MATFPQFIATFCLILLFYSTSIPLLHAQTDSPEAIADTFLVRSARPQIYNVLMNDKINYDYKINKLMVVRKPKGTLKIRREHGVDKVSYAADYEGGEPDVFTYKICDLQAQCDTAQVLFVKCPPKKPKFPTVEKVILEAGNQYEFNYPNMFIEVSKYPQNGRLDIPEDSSSIVYIPNEGFTGEDKLVFTVYEYYELCGMNHYESLNNKIYVLPSDENNKPPVAVDDHITVKSGRSIKIKVMENDYDPEGVLEPKIQSLTRARRGKVRRSRDKVSYTADRKQKGKDKLIYEICDFNGECTKGTVWITIE